MRIVISAGDPSGDIRSGELLEELTKMTPLEVSGLGGRNIQKAGGKIIFSLYDYSVMGFAEVISSLAKFRSLRSRMKSHILAVDPDIVLLVDYPGFNIPLAIWAKKRGYRVVYYISPQLWAWGRGRVRKIRKSVDLMITLFKFEVDFYRRYGVRALCSGHPLADSIPIHFESEPGRKIAFLPGSRRQEISLLLKPMMDSFIILRDSGVVSNATVAVSSDVPSDLYESAGSIKGVELVYSVGDALENASAAVVCSGTATLETAMWGIPFIITYRTSPLTYFLARMLVRGVSKIGMANLVAGSEIAAELIQKEVYPENIVRYVKPLLEDTEARRRSLSGMKLVREALGSEGSSERAARYILEETSDEIS
ncbi:MAG: lipid-A-disaccharide synthase [Candidatus Aegiribacteria sp.]|nr:lipid-A-disaccharide synthase [Candidatus Aegiribacteria sp.]